jgi:dolichyl-phosphate beta-glucosyltransferase
MGCELSVVIPAYNEETRLPPTLSSVTDFVAANPRWQPAEIVVVDDGSTDGTAVAARARPAGDRVTVQLVSHETNLGKGAAVRSGFLASRGRWVLLSDADLSAPIEELDSLAVHAAGGAVAVGSRAVDRRLISVPQPHHRDLMGRTFNLVLRTLGLTELHDTQCGFKLFPGGLARSLASAQQVAGFAYDVELLLLAASWGTPVREVGVQWHHVEASRVLALRHSRQMLADALRLWWRRTTGRLPPAPPELRS